MLPVNIAKNIINGAYREFPKETGLQEAFEQGLPSLNKKNTVVA